MTESLSMEAQLALSVLREHGPFTLEEATAAMEAFGVEEEVMARAIEYAIRNRLVFYSVGDRGVRFYWRK